MIPQSVCCCLGHKCLGQCSNAWAIGKLEDFIRDKMQYLYFTPLYDKQHRIDIYAIAKTFSLRKVQGAIVHIHKKNLCEILYETNL